MRGILNILILGLILVPEVKAAIKVPRVFSDHMVVQAGRALPVWGTAAPGSKIQVSLAGRKGEATADEKGEWLVALDAVEPGACGDLTVDGDGELVIKDVLAGEVWLCSGQSNMALPVSKAKDPEKEITAAIWPEIRMLQQGNKWVTCSPETVGAFSAVAYYFGRELHRQTGRPVGLLNASSGGTPIELWTSAEAQKAVPELKPLFGNEAVTMAGAEDSKQAESDRQQAVEVEGKQAVASRKTEPGYLFEDRIVPLVPFAIQGVIWYQGEANSYTVNANLYGVQLATMIRDWRARWGYDFEFLTVQLPEFGAPQTEPEQTHGRVLVREGELKSLELPHTGLAVTLGTGEEKSNHPLDKQEVGRRLAQWALAGVYKMDGVVPSGPLPADSKVSGDSVVISFLHTDGGLVANGGGELKGFAIAGEDMNWVWGNARIEGDTVVVSSPEVKQPVAVRYAWATNPAGCNLYNGAGLPATPFRTDQQALSNKARN